MILVPVAALIAFVLSLLLGVAYIDFLKKKTMSQYILDEAPDRHKEKKRNTYDGGLFYCSFFVDCCGCGAFYGGKNLYGRFFAADNLCFLYVRRNAG